MGSVSVNDILITQLKRIQVAGGDVLHGMKCSDPGYVDFGEAYFSSIKYSRVKAWKKHTKMTMNLVVPIGKVKSVFFNDKKKVFQKIIIGANCYKRISVPPNIWFAFQGMSKNVNLIINFSDIIVKKVKDVKSIDLNQINYKWSN